MGIPHYHPGPKCFCDRPDGLTAAAVAASSEEELAEFERRFAEARRPTRIVPTHEERTERPSA